MLWNCLAVGAGGFMGSVLRYLIALCVPQTSFPWATLGINVAGSFILAVLAGLVLRGDIANYQLSLMLRVGLCGGFTALSAYSLETAQFVSQGAYGSAIVYSLATCVLCVGAAMAGSVLVR